MAQHVIVSSVIRLVAQTPDICSSQNEEFFDQHSNTGNLIRTIKQSANSYGADSLVLGMSQGISQSLASDGSSEHAPFFAIHSFEWA